MWDCFFFFKQKTAYEMRISDWSSDVCSSDLPCWQGKWWARQDSNPQPSRYERPALTIELQAPRGDAGAIAECARRWQGPLGQAALGQAALGQAALVRCARGSPSPAQRPQGSDRHRAAREGRKKEPQKRE